MIAQSLAKQLASPLAQPLTGRQGGGIPFSPAQIASCRLLFDASDITTLFQDIAATTPVTAADQDVLGLRDLTSNATLLIRASTAPRYRESGGLKYLDWSGGRHGLANVVDLSAHNVLMTVTAITKLSDAATGVFATHGTTTNPSFELRAPNGATNQFRATTHGGTLRAAVIAGPSAPTTVIISSKHRVNNATPSTELQINNGSWTVSNDSAGAAATFSSSAGYSLGAQFAIFGLNGYIYTHALFTSILSDEDHTLVKEWMAARSGVTL